MEKRKRGRISKVDLLPDEIKAKLGILLRDRRYTQDTIREIVNDLIDKAGLSEEYKLSRTGLNRYASKMEEVGARIRESREMARIWTKQLGEEPQSDVGQLLTEFIKLLAFEAGLKMDKSSPASAEVLSKLALVANRIEHADSMRQKREVAIRKELAQKAAEQTEKIVTQAGISAETVNEIKRQILGLGD